MPNFNNHKQLEEYIRQAIDSTIQNEVFEVIRDEWLDVQDRRVYQSYEPSRYQRRQNDGLSDPANIKISPPKISTGLTEFVMENIAKGNGWDDWNGRLINDMIEGSDGFAGNPATGMPARPYTEETVANLTSGISREAVKQAFENGLKRFGLSITIN